MGSVIMVNGMIILPITVLLLYNTQSQHLGHSYNNETDLAHDICFLS